MHPAGRGMRQRRYRMKDRTLGCPLSCLPLVAATRGIQLTANCNAWCVRGSTGAVVKFKPQLPKDAAVGDTAMLEFAAVNSAGKVRPLTTSPRPHRPMDVLWGRLVRRQPVRTIRGAGIED
jgi:hypothetical protein